MTELERRNLELVMIAMSTTNSTAGATYQLPEDVMMKYAALIREDERKRCSRVAEDYVKDFDRDYREVGLEIAGHIEALK